MKRVGTIILSYAANTYLSKLTRLTIHSLRESTHEADLQIVVVETSDYSWNHLDVKTVNPGIPFNYNKFMQIGYSNLDNPDYVLMSNNDVVYHNHCVDRMVEGIQGQVISVTPSEPRTLTQDDLTATPWGWSILVSNLLFQKIDYNLIFPDEFPFWYQDIYYSDWVRHLKLRHTQLANANATHLEEQSHKLLDGPFMTTGQDPVFQRMRHDLEQDFLSGKYQKY